MSTNSNIIAQGTLSFYMTGEGFTYLVRDFWNSNLVKTAIECCTDSGIPIDVALKICVGEYKCVGDTREGDHTLGITEDDNPEGIYFTLESQISHLEKKFVDISQKLSRTTRKYELLAGIEKGDGTLISAGEASIYGAHYRKTYSKIDKKIIENCKDEQKKILENLSILYPLAGKTMADLPISRIGTEFSDIEIDHYEQYEYRTKDIEDDVIDKVNSKKEKKPFNENSYDQGDDESDEQYVKRMSKLAEKNNPIEDIKTTKSINGWISPDGKFYNVEFQPFPMHINAASDYKYLGIVPNDAYNESQWLEENGWMKYTGGEFYLDGKLTQSQIDLLMDYMTSKNTKTIPWFGYDEPLSKVIKDNESLYRIRSDSKY